MSVLKVGYSAPDIKQFVQEPVVVEEGTPIRFTDTNGNILTTLGYDNGTIDFKTTSLAIADGNSWKVYANGGNGVVRFWNGPNGLALNTAGITYAPPATLPTDVTLSPAQMATLCGTFTRGIFLVNGIGNLYDTGASAQGVNFYVKEDPSGADLFVGQAFSEVGSDSGRNFGNYWSIPFQFAVGLIYPVDVTKSYRFYFLGGTAKITQIQFIPLY